MKFKLHDRVKVINVKDSVYRDCVGATGIIVDVDSSWTYPYEIEFDEGKKFVKDLFHDSEIVLFEEDTKNYIDIKFKNGKSDGASVGDVIDVLLANLKIRHNNCNNLGMNYRLNIANAIARLTEAKMWTEELDKVDK